MKQLRAALDPLRTGFYDERLDNGLDVGAGAGGGPQERHLRGHPCGRDRVPFKDDAIVMMKKLVADARREPGRRALRLLAAEQPAQSLHPDRALEGSGHARCPQRRTRHARVPRPDRPHAGRAL